MDTLLQDLRHAVRSLVGNRFSTVLAVLTLAVCIGASTALFAIVNTLLLRPLPFARAGDIYVVSNAYRGARNEFASFADVTAWRAETNVFTHVAAIIEDSATTTTHGTPEALNGASVSEDFFGLFELRPYIGRTFQPSEYRAGNEKVVVLSYGLWRSLFAGDRTTLGATLILQSEPHTVVGVMPADFAFPAQTQFWRPLVFELPDAGHDGDVVRVVARLRRDITPHVARSQLNQRIPLQMQRRGVDRRDWTIELVSLQAQSTEESRRTLLALFGAVGCLLLAANTNVGLLLLSRGVHTVPAFAIRAALGAGPARIARQILTETVLLALAGGLAGAAVGIWILAVLRRYWPGQPTLFDVVTVDASVLVFTLGLSTVTGCLVGVAPLSRLLRIDIAAVLREGRATSTANRQTLRLMRRLAGVQVVVTVVLLSASLLMIRTIDRLYTSDLGFNPERLLTFHLSLPEVNYPTGARSTELFRSVVERLSALPGVQSASAINALYIQWGDAFRSRIYVIGGVASSDAEPSVYVRAVDQHIHRTLGVPLLRGRLFAAADCTAGTRSAIINQSTARRFFGDTDPVGRSIALRSDAKRGDLFTIIGVVGDVRQRALDVDVYPEIQLPYCQVDVLQMTFVVRAVSNPLALMPSIRSLVRGLDRGLPITLVQTMDEVLSTSIASRIFGTYVLSAFTGAALLLTGMALYGVVSTLIGIRMRDIATRLACGASPLQLLCEMCGDIVKWISAWGAAGVVTALLATRYIEPLLFGVQRTDIRVYVGAAGVLCLVVAVSSCIPLRRLMRLDPAATLRVD